MLITTFDHLHRHSLFSWALSTTLLISGFLYFMWSLSQTIMTAVGLSDSEIVQSLVFLWITQLVEVAIDVPWTVYSLFVIEEKHEFNKQVCM